MELNVSLDHIVSLVQIVNLDQIVSLDQRAVELNVSFDQIVSLQNNLSLVAFENWLISANFSRIHGNFF